MTNKLPITDLEQTVEGMLSDNYKERFIAEYQQVALRRDINKDKIAISKSVKSIIYKTSFLIF